MNTSRNLIFIGVCLILFGGYYYFKSADTSHSEANPKQEQKEAEEPIHSKNNTKVQVASIEKLNKYAECFNRNGERAHQSLNRYLSWVDKNTGPTGKERNIYGLYTIYGAEYYCDNMEKWDNESPDMPKLETAVKDYVKKMQALEALLKKADAYYTAENYKDDGFAQGKSMHKTLLNAFDAFFESETFFRTCYTNEVSHTNIPKDAVYEIYIKSFGLESIMYSDNSSVAVMQEAIRLLEEKTDAFESKNPTFAKAQSSFVSETRSLLKAAKDIMRNLRDNKYPIGSQEWRQDVGRFTGTFNNLQDTYNRIALEGGGKRLSGLYLAHSTK